MMKSRTHWNVADSLLMDPYEAVETLKSRDGVFFNKDVLFSNTVRTMVNINDEVEDNEKSKKVRAGRKKTVTMGHPCDAAADVKSSSRLLSVESHIPPVKQSASEHTWLLSSYFCPFSCASSIPNRKFKFNFPSLMTAMVENKHSLAGMHKAPPIAKSAYTYTYVPMAKCECEPKFQNMINSFRHYAESFLHVMISIDADGSATPTMGGGSRGYSTKRSHLALLFALVYILHRERAAACAWYNKCYTVNVSGLAVCGNRTIRRSYIELRDLEGADAFHDMQ
uniref:Uncharacterized protein n=1 Tax=Parascaris equorum TaxID=6256 RepID=A0A914S8C2_PAREQ